MSPISSGEFVSLHENFAQVNISAGMNPHFLDRAEAELEAAKAKKEKKSSSAGEVMSETMAGAYLVPQRASQLLEYRPYVGNIPDTMENEKNLRLNANEVGWQIHQVDDPALIPVLCQFVGGLKLDNIGKEDLVSDAISEKVAILAVHKIVELIGKNGGTVDFDLPEQVTTYIDTVRRVKEVMYKLEALAEAHPILDTPMHEVVNPDEKWQGQEEMADVIRAQEEEFLGSQVFRLVAGNKNYLRRAIEYSQLWEKEGLGTEEIYHLNKEQVDRVIQLGARYFSWYTLLDEQWQGKAEDNYFDDFQAFITTFNDFEDPNFIGHLVDSDVHGLTSIELAVVDEVLFDDDNEDDEGSDLNHGDVTGNTYVTTLE